MKKNLKQQTEDLEIQHQIRQTLGHANDNLIINILSTGADLDEVAQALEWLEHDDYMGAMLKKPLTDRTFYIYEVLRSHRN